MKRSELGKLLKTQREKLNLTPYKLAKEACVKQTTISEIEKGTTNYTITSFMSVTNELKIPLYMEIEGKMILINDIERTN